jgi:hypothetical protein
MERASYVRRSTEVLWQCAWRARAAILLLED